jgi:ribonuclease HII
MVARAPQSRRAAGCVPTCDSELALWRAGYRAVAGIDEVGRGPLAGPVVAAAVILPPFFTAGWLDDVRDSKLLPSARRERLGALIRREALAVGVGIRSARSIDEQGLAPATRAAMRDALAMLAVPPDFLLLDAFLLRDVECDQIALIHGDARCVSIACASIVAKTARDRMLTGLDRRFPGYGFAVNKGYGTAAHRDALEALGPCPVHRRSFSPVQACLDTKDPPRSAQVPNPQSAIRNPQSP